MACGYSVGRGLDPAACFLRPGGLRVVGMFPPLRLPSAGTSPIRGGFILYHPSKAPLSGELDAPQAQTEGLCSPGPRTRRKVPHLPRRSHGGVKTPPYGPPQTAFFVFDFPAGRRGRMYAARGCWRRRDGFAGEWIVYGCTVGRGLDPAACFCGPEGCGLWGCSHPSVCLRQTPPLRGEALLYCPLALHLPEHAHGKVQPPPYTPTAKQQKQQAAQT